jgi:hypothetical protein
MSFDLCLLADLKTRLKITNTNADVELQALIDQCSTDFHSACNRTNLFTKNYTERRDGHGTRIMLLQQGPIQSVTTLAIGYINVPPSLDGVQRGFVFDSSTIKLVGYRFSEGYGNVLINYSAGYGLQSALTLGDPAFPDDIELAVLDWCELRYRQRPAAGMRGKRLATGESVSYDLREIPDNTQRVITRYMRKAAAL